MRPEKKVQRVRSPYTATLEWLRAEHGRLTHELARLDKALAAIEALA